ncbi:MAG: c-type cytochrome [Pyrinomonadaceae bacterium]
MQDTPRYEAYEAGDTKFFADGAASRPLVEGTVPRGAQYRNADAYLYTGKGDPNGGGPLPASAAATGGVPAAAANLNTGAGGAQPIGDVNVRGNTAGGVPAGGAAGAGPYAGPDVFPFPITENELTRGRERYEAFCSMCHGLTGDGDGMIVRRGFRRPPSFHSEQLLEGNADASHFFDVITNGWGAMPDYAAQIPAEDRWRIIAYVRALQLSRRGTVEDVPADKRAGLSGGGGGQQQQGQQQPQHGGTDH